MNQQWTSYYKFNAQGTELHKWLTNDENKELIANKNLFYIVSPVQDQHPKETVIKFGIALGSGNKAWKRLYDYVIYYGISNRTNPKQGVFLHYLAGTHYNRYVLWNRTSVAKAELILKNYLRENMKIKRFRGTERTVATPEFVFGLLSKKNEDVSEKEVELVRSARIAAKLKAGIN